MASSDRDFVYDINDRHKLQSHYDLLKDNERTAFWWALGLGVITTGVARKATKL
jgi:hypothetical protein